MIKSNELRLGNYILDVFDLKNTVIRKIDLEDLSMFINYSNHPLPFRPITLTEEILLKCGFLNLPILDNHFYVEGMLILKRDEMFIHDKTGVELKYLHQLQNLIYALTNQELNIEL